MHYWIVNGKQMTEAEYQDHQRQELEAGSEYNARRRRW
jgi:hypothetical protein